MAHTRDQATDAPQPTPSNRAASSDSRLHASAAHVDALAGESAAIQRTRSQVQRIAPYFRIALVRGEVGSGKEFVARALHAGSAGSNGPLVAIEALAAAETTAEQSSVPSSATSAVDGANQLLESAQGGTLLLRNLGELPFDLQPGLLRLLRTTEDRRPGMPQQRRWDLRVIATTHRDLRTMVAVGQFRQDLYSRISVVEIQVPSLRQRAEDLPVLVEDILHGVAERSGRTAVLSDAAMAHIGRHTWPGNLDELSTVLTQAAALADSNTIGPSHLSAFAADATSKPANPAAPRVERLHDVMHQHVMAVLTRCAGNKLRAAELLGISRSTLYRMLEATAPLTE